MRAIIEKIELSNFKGCRNSTYEFGKKSNSILGQNGAGKSTIAAAWYWAFANCDSDLHNNPAIFPLDVEECTPTVRIWLNCNEKSVEIAKMQKKTIRKSKTGGADTVSLSNSYEVNSVEYGERDFKKKLTELGFDFDLFLPLSHPDVFTSQKSADMRKVLFGMASEKSDKEIADMTDGAEDVAEMLTNYTAEEVKAMQNATLRKIREEYGKDGEILRAKIEGMEQSKTDIDVAELELQKNALNEQIADNKAKQADISKEFEEQQKASDGVIELKMELNSLQQKANESLDNKRREIRNELSDLDFQLKEVKHQIRLNKQDIQAAEDSIKSNDARIQTEYGKWTDCVNELKSVEKHEMDDNSLICSMCGQEFPTEKKKELVADFDEKKRTKIEQLKSDKTATEKRGKELRAAIDKDKAEIEQLKATLKENKDEEINLAESIKGLEKCLEEVPQSIDISDRPEVQEIQRQIAEKEQAMNKGNSAEEIRQQLKAEGEDLQSQLTEVEKQLALAQHNIEIDEQIADLRKKQGEFEQNKANAEKILYQLDLVSRKKNTLLQDDVNSNFELVDFKLFDWLKNGEYKETCMPTYRNKDMGISTNTGLEMLMKLDIIRGLQSFYNMYLPVFVDGAEALSESTTKMINMDTQIILLKVTEDKELKVEVN